MDAKHVELQGSQLYPVRLQIDAARDIARGHAYRGQVGARQRGQTQIAAFHGDGFDRQPAVAQGRQIRMQDGAVQARHGLTKVVPAVQKNAVRHQARRGVNTQAVQHHAECVGIHPPGAASG